MKALTLVLLFGVLYGCATRTSLFEEITAKSQADRHMASFEVKMLQGKYEGASEYIKEHFPGSYPAAVAGYVFLNLSAKGIAAAMKDPDRVDNLPRSFPDASRPTHSEGREYLAFMKAQMLKWARNEISWPEADYTVVAKGNEIKKRFDDEFARVSQQQEMEKQTQAMEAIGRHRPSQTVIVGPSGGLDFLCRDAIQSNNKAGIWVHC